MQSMALVKIPAPKLIVFYNGKDKLEDETFLKLSDAFYEGTKGDIEATVRMLNINYGRNKTLTKACKPLQEYAWIVDKIRTYAKQMPTENAVDKTIAEMPDTFLLKPFLLKHKAEVKGMILTEYNELEHEEFIRTMERAEGKAEGKAEAIINMMKKLKLSFEQAAEILNISSDDYPIYKKVIAEMWSSRSKV